MNSEKSNSDSYSDEYDDSYSSLSRDLEANRKMTPRPVYARPITPAPKSTSRGLSRGVIIPLLILGALSIMAACLLWFLGHNKQNDWNSNAVQVNGKITKTSVREKVCFDRDCTPDVNNQPQQCSITRYPCWDGIVYFNYNANQMTIDKEYAVISDARSSSGIQNTLNTQYPPNSIFPGYYQNNNVNDWQKDLYPESSIAGFLAGTIIFAILAGIMFITGLACGIRKAL